MTILVVDDNEQNVELLEILLGGNGYQVVTAADGAEALAKARQTPPDLIVSDILMPVMDGFALCREWKKDERLWPIPFVFYTATYTHEEDREFALSLGAERFLVKPDEPKAFMQTIREVIQQIKASARCPDPRPIEAPPEEEVGYLQQYNAVLIRKLEAKMQQLEQTNRELEQSLAERKQMEEKMQTYQKKLQLLNSQLSETEEQERRRLAIELHDSIGQKLALLKMKLGTIRQSEPPQNVLEQLDECGKVFDEMIKDTRSLTFQLSPPLLHQIGLNATVEWLAEKISKEHGLEFELEKPEKEHPLDEKLRFLVYRCIQELLTNVIKHSQAHKVGLSIRQDGDLMKIRIEDDGVGFDPHALGSSGRTEGFGLFSIRERLSNLGGLFKVDSAPGRGTRINLVIPVDNDG